MPDHPIPTSRRQAEALDRADPLAMVRLRFALPEGVTYLDGHSLGPATHAALAGLNHAARCEWAQGLIGSWNAAGWIELPAKVGAQIARLIGAPAQGVIVCDSVSVNIFKLAAAALPHARGKALIIESDEFPTDQYVAEGLADLIGAKLERVGCEAGADALRRIGGVLIKSVINYRTARITDIEAHERAAMEGGGLIVWDLSHAAGVFDLASARRGVRLAAGCTYKYLNGGPGAPAFIYVEEALAAELRSPIPGWMGHAAPFAFDAAYTPKPAAARFAAGTPGILSLTALAHALDAFEGVDLKMAEAKAQRLGDLCLMLAAQLGLNSPSPAIGETRGGHISLLHEEGYAIVQALIARGIIADFRAPDAMRFGFSPLFVRFVDVWDAMAALADILRTRAWDTPSFRTRAAVT